MFLGRHRSVLLFDIGAIDDDNRAIFADPDSAFERLGYTPEELGQFTRYVKIYVDEQRKLYMSILASLDVVEKWHKHLDEQ